MLKDKRKQIIDYIKANKDFLSNNAQALDIYQGNLLPYVDMILRDSLSDTYYQAIKHRILPINILQRYIDKVSTTYSKPPERSSEDVQGQEFVEFYSTALNINISAQQADVYANLFKGYAWEPYVNKNKEPKLREMPFDSFLVMSDSDISPDEETIFIKFMGMKNEDPASMLLFVYTDTEFDAFYLDNMEASEYLVENQGLNPVGVIPFVYGKRQRNKLLPTIDSDMLAICKAIPTMITDAAGALLFQCFSIIFGIDILAENLKMSPNSFWNLKSDPQSEKTPSIGTIKPEADTDKALQFITSIFIIWLETKGIRVGSIGNVDGGSVASGISKVIDEMDVYEVKRKSMDWFRMDEEELWNNKLPKIHNYWIKTGMVQSSLVPGQIPDNKDLMIKVEFDKPEPMQSRASEIADIKAEIDLGTMTMDQAVRALHPDHTDEMVSEVLANRVIV